nr:MAG TPA: hypothetical protein [Caudoviricetes sp.]
MQRYGYLEKDKHQKLYGVWCEKYPFHRLFKDSTQVGHHVGRMHTIVVVFYLMKYRIVL